MRLLQSTEVSECPGNPVSYTHLASNARIPFLEVARACNVSGAAIHPVSYTHLLALL